MADAKALMLSELTEAFPRLAFIPSNLQSDTKELIDIETDCAASVVKLCV